MGGGLMQLVAYGAQDIYLTGNPQITFFKVVYRRHTNFSMEAIEQTFNGTVGSGNKVTATISRNGDLVSRMYMDMKIELSNLGLFKNGEESKFTKDTAIEMLYVRYKNQKSLLSKIAKGIIKITGKYSIYKL